MSEKSLEYETYGDYKAVRHTAIVSPILYIRDRFIIVSPNFGFFRVAPSLSKTGLNAAERRQQLHDKLWEMTRSLSIDTEELERPVSKMEEAFAKKIETIEKEKPSEEAASRREERRASWEKYKDSTSFSISEDVNYKFGSMILSEGVFVVDESISSVSNEDGSSDGTDRQMMVTPSIQITKTYMPAVDQTFPTINRGLSPVSELKSNPSTRSASPCSSSSVKSAQKPLSANKLAVKADIEQNNRPEIREMKPVYTRSARKKELKKPQSESFRTGVNGTAWKKKELNN